MKRLFALSAVVLLFGMLASGQALSPKWEELTSGDFVKAIERSQGTCLLPLGIIEKHAQHLPLGTDLINVRGAVMNAVASEYAVVFPEYFVGQIFEAQHQPGTVSYSTSLQMQSLQETVSEMARNGCKKVIIVNGHGGNEHLLPYFAQTQLASPRDYVVYVYGLTDITGPDRPAKKTTLDMHAGEDETSRMLAVRPDLVKTEMAKAESGADQDRLKGLPPQLYTAIWWYAKFPNHYSGDGSVATKELGEYDVKAWAKGIAEAIRSVKSDATSLTLQNEFFERSKHPLDAAPDQKSPRKK